MYDFLIIGGGVLGCAVARELTRYSFGVAVAEAETDVCAAEAGTGGMICAARTLLPFRLNASKYAVTGERMFGAYAAALDVPYKRTGAMFAFTDVSACAALAARCRRVGLPFEECDPSRAAEVEPALSSCLGAKRALYFPNAGIADGCEFVFALRENAERNGAEFYFGCAAESAESDGHVVTVTFAGGKRISARNVICCAGSGAEVLSRSFGDNVRLYRREETVAVADVPARPRMPVFYDGKSYVSPRTCGRYLAGADDAPHSLARPAASGMPQATERLAGMGVALSSPQYFAASRADCGGDLAIVSGGTPGVRYVAGAGSYGLTVAPALASTLARSFGLPRNMSFVPSRKGMVRVSRLGAAERNALALSERGYGRIVLASPLVTEGEIADAARRGANTVAGLDRRLLPAGVSGGVRFAEALAQLGKSDCFAEDEDAHR